jgi:[acyl-carrier-protein] S-malonyltransferase
LHAAQAGRAILDEIKARLVEQLTAPVRWEASCRWLAGNKSGAWQELAPGKTLAGLMRRIDKNVKVVSHDEPTQ